MDRAVAPDPHHGHHRYLDTRTFGALDGLRAIAILVVVWHHAASPIAGWPITARGYLGVDLFFVISGFLIVTLLLRERRRSGAISLRDFYLRRALRILPPYFLMLMVVGATALLTASNRAAVLHDLPFAFFYLSNLVPMQSMLGITWSLSVEEQFYLVVPALQKHAQRALPVLLHAVYVAVTLPPFGFLPEIELPTFFRETTFGPILLGVMLAHVLDDARGFAAVARAASWRFAPVVALALVVLAASHPAGDISGWPRLTIHWSVLLLVASCVVREQHELRPLLTWWPMRRVGVVSYGIYLYHLIVMHFVNRGLDVIGTSSDLLRVVATALLTWAAAEASYHLLEVRFLALKSRFAGTTAVAASIDRRADAKGALASWLTS